MRAVMSGRVAMRKIRVKVGELLVKVKENRIAHIKEYREGVEGYKEAAKREVEQGMLQLQKQIDCLREGEVMRLASVHLALDVPESHEKDYDQVIAMLEMCVESEIEVQSDEFACYVMDDWDWKQEFLNVTGNYKARR